MFTENTSQSSPDAYASSDLSQCEKAISPEQNHSVPDHCQRLSHLTSQSEGTKTRQRQLILTEENNHEKQLKIQQLNNLLVEQKHLNENLVAKTNDRAMELQNELEERKFFVQKLKNKCPKCNWSIELKWNRSKNAEKDCQYGEKRRIERRNQDLKEKLVQEENLLRER